MIEEIESKRLVLRKTQKSDWFVLYETITHPSFPEYLPLKGLIQTEQDAKKWIDTAIVDWDTQQRLTWTLCLKTDENPPIGQVSLSHRIEDDKWHTAFWVSNRYQSEGYATEAVSILTEVLPFKFWAGAAIWNKASNRVLLNCGFKRIGTNENGYTCKGKMISIYAYEKV